MGLVKKLQETKNVQLCKLYNFCFKTFFEIQFFKLFLRTGCTSLNRFHKKLSRFNWVIIESLFRQKNNPFFGAKTGFSVSRQPVVNLKFWSLILLVLTFANTTPHSGPGNRQKRSKFNKVTTIHDIGAVLSTYLYVFWAAEFEFGIIFHFGWGVDPVEGEKVKNHSISISDTSKCMFLKP